MPKINLCYLGTSEFLSCGISVLFNKPCENVTRSYDPKFDKAEWKLYERLEIIKILSILWQLKACDPPSFFPYFSATYVVTRKAWWIQ